MSKVGREDAGGRSSERGQDQWIIHPFKAGEVECCGEPARQEAIASVGCLRLGVGRPVNNIKDTAVAVSGALGNGEQQRSEGFREGEARLPFIGILAGLVS